MVNEPEVAERLAAVLDGFAWVGWPDAGSRSTPRTLLQPTALSGAAQACGLGGAERSYAAEGLRDGSQERAEHSRPTTALSRLAGAVQPIPGPRCHRPVILRPRTRASQPKGRAIL